MKVNEVWWGANKNLLIVFTLLELEGASEGRSHAGARWCAKSVICLLLPCVLGGTLYGPLGIQFGPFWDPHLTPIRPYGVQCLTARMQSLPLPPHYTMVHNHSGRYVSSKHRDIMICERYEKVCCQVVRCPKHLQKQLKTSCQHAKDSTFFLRWLHP